MVRGQIQKTILKRESGETQSDISTSGKKFNRNSKRISEKFKRVDGIHPLKSKPKRHAIFGMDIETCDRYEKSDNQKFLVGSIVGDAFQELFYDKNTFEKILHHQRFRNSYICCTNLHFDINGIYSCFSKNPVSELFSKYYILERNGSYTYMVCYISYDSKDSGVYSKYHIDNLCLKKTKEQRASIRKSYYKIYFVDSNSHMKSGVQKLGEIIKFEKMQTPENIGSMPENDEQWQYLIKYNINDSTVTYKFMKWLQDEYNSLGCEMKSTISSTSLDLFRRKYLIGVICRESREKILFQYVGYFGGRTEVFRRGRFVKQKSGMIKCYDVNSLYPFILSSGIFPYPKSGEIRKVCVEEVKFLEGIADFELECPLMKIPFLAVKHDGKLIFPTGLIKGRFTFIEIRYALSLGYKILDIGEGLVYKNKFNPFSRFITDLYEYRRKRKASGDSSELIPKILMNSFYGKFGFRYDNKDMMIDRKDFDTLVCTDEKIEQVEIKGMYHDSSMIRISFGKENSIPQYVIPIISIYVTSQARIHMHKLMTSIGHDNIIYTDTDSIYTNKNVNNNLELGNLKLEASYDDITFIKAKMYACEKFIKIKGMNRFTCGYDGFIKMCNQGKIVNKMKQFTKLRTSLISGKGLNSVHDMIKECDLNDDKRIWAEDDFTLEIQDSRPMHFTSATYKNI